MRPPNVADVQATLRVGRPSRGAPVIPFGLGSGVVGGVIASPDAIVLDMSADGPVRFIDPINLLAGFDAGKNGPEAEAAVAAQGLTIGHWPQSVAVSSVGGWVATRASGQFSTAYGNIEDIVHSIEAVLPNGELVILGKGPRASAGPDLRHLMLGSEGHAGRDHRRHLLAAPRAAERRALSVFEVADMDRGFDLQREIVQPGWRPPVMRQYDERESRRLDARAERLPAPDGPRGPAGAGRGRGRRRRRSSRPAAGATPRAGRHRRALARAPQQRAAAGIGSWRATWSSTRSRSRPPGTGSARSMTTRSPP